MSRDLGERRMIEGVLERLKLVLGVSCYPIIYDRNLLFNFCAVMGTARLIRGR